MGALREVAVDETTLKAMVLVSHLCSAQTLGLLRSKGIISRDEVAALYDHLLLTLESFQNAPGAQAEVFEVARQIVERAMAENI